MPGKTIKIRSREGGEFDCYLSTPATDGRVPAVVLASAVHGVDKAFHPETRAFSMGRALAILDGLRREGRGPALRQAS